jgi:hypothetical protein
MLAKTCCLIITDGLPLERHLQHPTKDSTPRSPSISPKKTNRARTWIAEALEHQGKANGSVTQSKTVIAPVIVSIIEALSGVVTSEPACPHQLRSNSCYVVCRFDRFYHSIVKVVVIFANIMAI